MTDKLTGRELDAAVAVECLKLEFRPIACPLYSENMGDAWQVAEWIQKRTDDFMLLWNTDNTRKWECTFYVVVGDSIQARSGYADTPAEAICLAALELARHLKGASDE